MRGTGGRAGLATILWTAALIAGTPAAAQENAAQTEEARTLMLASNCANCHGTTGQGAPPMLPLAGRPYENLRDQLLAARRGELPAATIMLRIVSGYSEEELDLLARHFSSLPAGGAQ